MRLFLFALLVLFALLAPAVALAHEILEVRPDRDFVVSGQAGILTYAGEAARVTSPGATYGVSVGFNLRQGINLETGYQGAAYRAQDTPGVGIVENGGQALLQVGPEVRRVYPHAVWGLGVSRLTEMGGDDPAIRNATLVKMPMGVGLSYSLPTEGDADISLGARGLYSFTLDSGAFPGLGEPFAANQVTGALVVGGSF